MLGWFIASSALSEAKYRVAVAAFGDVRVREVMVSHPTCAPGDWTFARFLEHRALHSPHSSYPVIDRAGRPVGLLRWSQALHSPRDPRQHQLIAEACVPLDRCVVLDESVRVADALPRVARLRPADSAIVTCDGVVCGVLSPRDLARRMQIA